MFAGRIALLQPLLLVLFASYAAAAPQATPARRVVSINPSLTSMLLAIGAQDALVGVDEYSASQLPSVTGLPRVGGLFNPSLEAVVALRPDLVVLVPSSEQRDFRAQLEALGVRVEVFDNIRFDEVLENITRLGSLVGREREAQARVKAIRDERAAVTRAVAGLPPPRVLLVLQREPIFVVGRGNFIEEMVQAAGATNLGAEFADAYPQVTVEWVVARAPEVLLDMSLEPEEPASYWSRWPSLPALARGRVLRLDPALVSMPGPHLDRALEKLAVGLYGDEILPAIERERAR
jgi:iron complex transport system substrate-binding protein